MGDGVGAGTFFYRFRVGIAAPGAQKGIPAGVKAVYRRVDGVQRVVVAALAVFGLVVDRAALHLDLTGGEVALEVGGIVHGVPQAELYIAEYSKRFRRVAFVGQHQTVDLAVVAHGHEQLQPRSQPALFAGDDAVTQTVAALVKIQLGLGGLPAGVPDGAALFNIVIAAVIIPVAGDAAELSVLVKTVAARRVGDKAKESLAAQVVDPRQRCARGGDDVFPCVVIKVTELHRDPLLTNGIPAF